MTGSNPKQTKLEQLRDFMVGRADDTTREQIWNELQDPESDIALLFDHGPSAPMGLLDVLLHFNRSKSEPQRLSAEAMRSARQQARLSITQAVDIILKIPGDYKITEAELEAIETGKIPPPLTLQSALAKAYDTNLAKLNPFKEPFQASAFFGQHGDRPKAPQRQLEPIDDHLKRELMDFIPPTLAEEMLTAHQGGHVLEWLEDYLKRASTDPFFNLLTKVLVYTSLTGRHGAAAEPVDELVKLAGDDPRRRLQALYLQGRQRWYVNSIEAAAQSLDAAYHLAVDQSDQKHQAHCLLYLARLANVFPSKVTRSFDQLIQEAEELADAIGRSDIKLLALRAKIMRLRTSKEINKAVDEAKQLLGDFDNPAIAPQGNIIDSVRIELALAMRRFYTEQAREISDKMYDFVIARRPHDSHAGMCLYLKGDLEIDRMVEASQKHLEAREKNQESQASAFLRAAKKHHASALALCRRSYKLLETSYDVKAFQKVVRRLTFLENMDFPLPHTIEAAVDEYAVREHHLTQLLIASPLAFPQQNYEPSKPIEFTITEFKTLLTHYAAGMLLPPGRTVPGDSLDLDPYIRADCLVCLPWHTGNQMLVRVFSPVAGKDIVRSVSTFRIKNASQLQSVFQQFLAMPDNDFLYLRDRLYPEIQNAVETIDHVGAVNPATGRPWEVRHVAVFMPRSNYDWMYPLECLRTTDPDSAKQTSSLLDLAQETLVYVGSAQSSPSSLEIKLNPDEYQIFATQQQFNDRTVHDMAVRHFGEHITTFEIGTTPPPKIKSRGVMIVAHADRQSQLAEELSTWQWANTQAVILLFCSSSHYHGVSGPFIDGPAIRIREKQGDNGLVVAARVPVEPREAFLLADELRRTENREIPIAQIVTNYLQNHRDLDPFRVPWIVLS